MSRSVEFHEYARDADLAPDEFPHALKGPDKLKRLRVSAWSAITFGILSWIDKKFVDANKLSEMIGSSRDQDASAAGGAAKDFGSAALEFTLSLISVCLYVSAIIAAILTIVFGIIYAQNVIVRQRCFERDVVSNDAEAIRIKNELLRVKRIPQQIKELKSQMSKNNKSSGNSDAIESLARAMSREGAPQIKDIDEMDALKAFKKCYVNVNTRQDTLGDDIEKHYSIVFKSPDSVEADASLGKKIEGVEYVVTRILKGQVSIGAMIESRDRSLRRFTGSVVVDDKYAFTESDNASENKPKDYEHAFPLDLLIDHTEEINMKKDQALRWATQAAGAIDNLLSTSKTQANRQKVDVGSSSALFIYDMSTAIDIKNMDSMAETFNSAFKTKGSTISIDAGRILITIPLPKQFKLPIDVPSMYREVFF